MRSKRSWCVVFALAATTIELWLPPAVAAQDDSCVDVCGASCIKPWAIPDRWDDVTGIPGYMGDRGRRSPDWRNNAQWDSEAFTDGNGDGRFDPGESFIDGNGNGQRDEEIYHLSLTGYVAHPVPGNFLSPNGDLGLELILHPNYAGSAPEPGGYVKIALPPVNKGTPETGADVYRANIAGCNPSLVEPNDFLQLLAGGLIGPTNQGMGDIIAQDPNAYWDSSTETVQGSSFPLSPRVIFLAVYDPRLATPYGPVVQVTKIVAFFMERMTGSAEVRGRFMRAFAPGVTLGSPCQAGQVGGFIVDCPVPATTASWGRLKATYR